MVKCTYDKCNKIACYNIKNSKIPIFCIDHKLTNMTNITKSM